MSEEYPNAPPWIEEMLAENPLITATRKLRMKERIEELIEEARANALLKQKDRK